MKEAKGKYGKAILNLVLWISAIILSFWLIPKAIVYFLPFVIGAFIALMAAPIVHFLEKKFRIKRKASSAVIVMIVIAAVVILSYAILSKLITECIGFVDTMPQRIEVLEEDFKQIAKKTETLYDNLPEDIRITISNIVVNLKDMMINLLGNSGEPTIMAVGNFAKQLPLVIVGIIMSILSAYFFVVEQEYISQLTKKIMPNSMKRGFRILKFTLFKAVGGYFKAQFIIELWMFLFLIIGLTILEVEYVLPIALGMALLDFLPIFGTGTVIFPWVIIEFLSADYKMVIGLLIIWGGGQLIRQFIQPKIMGDSIGLSPIPTLFLLYIGYRAGGVIGLIIALPLGMVIYSLYKEGMFKTMEQSVQILVHGMNRFRKITPQDMEGIEKGEK